MKIILIEDDEAIVKAIKFICEDLGIEFHFASTVEGARFLIDQHHDADYFFVDGSLESTKVDTIPILVKIDSLGLPGQVVAISQSPASNQILLRNGAHHGMPKENLGNFLRVVHKLRRKR